MLGQQSKRFACQASWGLSSNHEEVLGGPATWYWSLASPFVNISWWKHCVPKRGKCDIRRLDHLEKGNLWMFTFGILEKTSHNVVRMDVASRPPPKDFQQTSAVSNTVSLKRETYLGFSADSTQNLWLHGSTCEPAIHFDQKVNEKLGRRSVNPFFFGILKSPSFQAFDGARKILEDSHPTRIRLRLNQLFFALKNLRPSKSFLTAHCVSAETQLSYAKLQISCHDGDRFPIRLWWQTCRFGWGWMILAAPLITDCDWWRFLWGWCFFFKRRDYFPEK